MLRALPPGTKEVFILAHHPLIRPANEELVLPRSIDISMWEKSRVFAYALLRYDSEQARKIVDLIADAAATVQGNVYVLYGHRHIKSSAKQGNITFLESPNLATDEDAWKGFFAKDARSTPCWNSMK